MLVSVIIPAFRAHGTLARAVNSALSQTHRDVEVIVVSDDGTDYRAVLHLDDEKLRFTSSGRVGSGCHNARNIGLAESRGEFIAHLDADDVFLPRRIATLLPIAQHCGAATDNTRVVDDATGVELYRAFADASPQTLDIAALLELSVPLFPLVAREHAQPRLAGIELGEDFVANLRLIDRLDALPVCAETLSEYHVVRGSLCHNDESAERFEQSYGDLIVRLETGDRLGLSPQNARIALAGLKRKRDFNRRFATARRQDADLDFQSFAARERQAFAR